MKLIASPDPAEGVVAVCTNARRWISIRVTYSVAWNVICRQLGYGKGEGIAVKTQHHKHHACTAYDTTHTVTMSALTHNR